MELKIKAHTLVASATSSRIQVSNTQNLPHRLRFVPIILTPTATKKRPTIAGFSPFFSAIFLTRLCLTGAVIWWPGAEKWKRSLIFDPRSNWKRLNWDLHSSAGFWSFALVFMWAFTGIYLVFPTPFQKLVNHYAPLDYYRLPDDAAVRAPVQSNPVKFVLVAYAAEAAAVLRLRGREEVRGDRVDHDAAVSFRITARAIRFCAGSTICTSEISRGPRRRLCGWCWG